MASFVDLGNKSKLDWALMFQRTGAFPLDRTDLFATYADAVKYAAGNTTDPDSRGLCGASYVGQIITVYENDAVTVYKIDADRSLKPIGGAIVGDDASIVNADGVMKLYGFAEAIAAGNFAGKQPRINAAGKIEWILPDTTTVDGLNTAVEGLLEDVGTMSTDIKNLQDNKVDKVDGMGLSSNDYTSDEKTKLAGIAAGAQVNVLESVKVNGTALDITNKAVDVTVPVKLSELTNDENFIDNTVANLVNYYTKTETYTKEEVNGLIGNISTIDIQIVEALPEADISTTTIYMVRRTSGKNKDIYDEYLYANGDWELIGNTQIDLSNYLTKTGDASNTTAAFTAAETRENIATGESLAVIFGKIAKYLADLKDVAFSGSYNDLSDTPTVPVAMEANIAAGDTTCTATVAGTLLSYHARDVVTGEEVIIDHLSPVSGNDHTFSISEAYANNIKLNILYV